MLCVLQGNKYKIVLTFQLHTGLRCMRRAREHETQTRTETRTTGWVVLRE